MKKLKFLYYILILLLTISSCTQPAEKQTSNGSNQHNEADTYPVEGEKLAADMPISDIVRRIFQDSKGQFWFGTNSEGICCYDEKKMTRFSIDQGLSGYQVTRILEDKKGMLWIATNGGVSMYDGKKFTNYTVKDGLPDNSTWSIFEDSKGIIWIGTANGVCTINNSQVSVFHLPYTEIKNSTSLVSYELVWCITEDAKGSIWFGTDGNGVFSFDGKSFNHITTENGLCDNSVSGILSDRKGQLWFSSMFNGVSRFDGKSFTNFNVQNAAVGDNEVWTMCEDRNQNIWIASEGFGVYCYDGKTMKNYAKKDGLNVLAVQSIFEDNAGKLWFGGAGGVYRFKGKTFEHIKTNGPWD